MDDVGEDNGASDELACVDGPGPVVDGNSVYATRVVERGEYDEWRDRGGEIERSPRCYLLTSNLLRVGTKGVLHEMRS